MGKIECGERRIRTFGSRRNTVLFRTQHRRINPLCHLSGAVIPSTPETMAHG
ncbi:hypothetical protein Pan189_19790 [Stratiformator vulcanicus]|uniref:Uncharacterized protein n=1 Tax=Stratiformator vulcanicus TaxID=2527980 RepID=A0A517R127_9PLAN|nr:hypothetical protein Pan189_19790 [Stratiformator vulcanicus]